MQYEGNVITIKMFPLEMPIVERLLNAGMNDFIGVTIGTSNIVILSGRIQSVKLTKLSSSLEEIAQLEIEITLAE